MRACVDNVSMTSGPEHRTVVSLQKRLAWRPGGPFAAEPRFELYDMAADPHERMNLYGQPGREPVRDELDQRLTAFFKQYADPQYDVWIYGKEPA